MLPPSDSFAHQSQKAEEVTANMQHIRSSIVPPPPYSRTISLNPFEDCDIGCDGVDGRYDTSSSPVTVYIDASVKVAGHGNTVVIPSSMTRRQQDADPKPATDDQVPPTPTSTPTAPAALLQSSQRHRQAKLTELATSIISTLRHSEHPAGSETDWHPTIEIKINTGIQVEGNRNVICAGVPGRSMATKGAHDDAVAGRKRRAQSVCIAYSLSWQSLLSSSYYPWYPFIIINVNPLAFLGAYRCTEM